jgi:uncharacterized protein (TIGR03437 family)
MRKIALLVMAVWGASLCSGQTAADFLDGSVLQEIRLTMSPDDWQSLHDHYLDKKTNYKCEFSWRGIVVANVGIHTRGSGSLNPIKPGLGIEFNKFTPGGTFLGMTSAVLRNFSEDPSAIHERLTMQVFARVGLPDLRTAHVRLVVNGQYVGLYELAEPIDTRFLTTRFGEATGYLYEAVGGQSFHFQYLGDDPASYVPALFDPKTHADAPQGEVIANMVRTANLATDATFVASMSKFMDLGAFVANAAMEIFMAESDGMLSTSGMTNFYFYRRSADDHWFFLPWDKEMTFSKPDWSIWQATEDNVLLHRALQVPELRQRYLDTLHQAAEFIGGQDGWLRQELEREYQQIRQSVIDDPNRVCVQNDAYARCPLEQFEAAVEYNRGFARERAAFVEAALQAAGWKQDARVPDLKPGSAVNAASGAALLSPGELVFVQASLPLNQTERAATWPLPLEIAGVSATVAGVRAPMVLASPTGAWIQTPVELPSGPTSITLSNSLGASHSTAVEIRPAAPGIFSVTHADGRVVDASAPGIESEVLVVWATGLGHALNDAASGQPAPTDRLAPTANAVSAVLDGAAIPVIWAGLSPGYAGLYQVVIQLPVGQAGGRAAMLALAMFGEPGVASQLMLR